MTQKNKLSVYKKHEKNPFVEDALEQINGHISKKYKTATKHGEKAVLQAVDPETGEPLGHTTFIRQVEVDEEKFTKVYLSQFSAFWDLGKQAIRVFGYIMTKLIPKQDMFPFFLKECMDHTGYKTKKPVYQGLADLLNAGIIARGPSDSFYFINPMIAFNGNRVTFAKSYVKKREKEAHNTNQIQMFENER